MTVLNPSQHPWFPSVIPSLSPRKQSSLREPKGPSQEGLQTMPLTSRFVYISFPRFSSLPTINNQEESFILSPKSLLVLDGPKRCTESGSCSLSVLMSSCCLPETKHTASLALIPLHLQSNSELGCCVWMFVNPQIYVRIISPEVTAVGRGLLGRECRLMAAIPWEEEKELS